jgi:hypothetical protein
VFIIFVVSLIIVGKYYYQASSNNYMNATQNSEIIAPMTVTKELRILNGEDIKNLYNNFHYANTNKIVDFPKITENSVADARIRTMAEARGYSMRRLARNTLGDADGHPIQFLAAKPWQDLKAAAAKDGIVLTITWAFRSIDDQRNIFLEGLRTLGVSTQNIAEGKVDDLVDKVLQTYAPPGYSRHHTGFTVDLTCGVNGLTNFASTNCHEWLASNNYIHPKTYGWIPSYPDGAEYQGPEPEPWEYIWVPTDYLLK